MNEISKVQAGVELYKKNGYTHISGQGQVDGNTNL